MIENPSQPSGFDSSMATDNLQADASGTGSQTAGSLLREAREAVGLHIAALAVALKVPVKKLEALEMDRHDLLPDMVFVRALASSVCRNLKIDPAPVLALLPHNGRPAFQQTPAAAQSSFHAYPTPVKPTHRSSSISATAAIAGLLLVAGAAVVVFLPTLRQAWSSSTVVGQAKDSAERLISKFNRQSLTADTAVDTSADVPVPGVMEVTGPKSLISSGETSPSAALPERAASAPTASAMAGMSLTPSLAASGSSGASAAVELPAKAANGFKGDAVAADAPVTFIASGQASWVKVTDAKGVVVLSRTISSGEQVAANGVLPLSVVVGRADATRVQIRGVAFDLAGYSRENVARFQVK